jgi:hypothetical protein
MDVDKLPEPNFCIEVEIPVIKLFRLSGRNRLPAMFHTFYPPTSTNDWPQTTADVNDRYLRQILVEWRYGPGAIGSAYHVLVL